MTHPAHSELCGPVKTINFDGRVITHFTILVDGKDTPIPIEFLPRVLACLTSQKDEA